MKDKYSKNSFSLVGLDTKKEKQMVKELEREILARIHPKILHEVESIIEELNASGHNLKYRINPVPGDISFIEKSGLRVAVDTVISCGYSNQSSDKKTG